MMILSVMQSRFLMVTFVSLIALSSIQCERGNRRVLSEESKVTILYMGDERILGPHWEMPAKFLVFLPLVTYDDKGDLEGRLAESWEHSPDYRTWTFHLRTDVTWHDGTPVTAEDIKFSLALFAHPDVLFGSAWYYIDSVSVVDDFTLTLTYTKPMSLPNSWAVYYPKHLLEKLEPKEFWKWEFWTHPVGNGPYRYVRHVPKTMIELEANPDYYLGKPRIERVILKFSGSVPLMELLSGNVDVLIYVNPSDIPKLAADPLFRVYHHHSSGAPWMEAIFWNHLSPFFRDPKVRRALTLAINRRELLQLLNMPDELPIVDVIFTGRQYRRGELPKPLPYDPELAKQLLEEVGWSDVEGNGVRQQAGRAFSFSALVPSGGALEQAAVYVQDQLRRVGIDMEVQVLESNLVRKRLRSGNYQAAFDRFFNLLPGHIEWLGESSRLGYHNPRVADLLRTVNYTADSDEQDRIYRELMFIIRADLPITFLFPQINTIVAHRRIQGLHSPYWADPVMNMEHLWLEEDNESE